MIYLPLMYDTVGCGVVDSKSSKMKLEMERERERVQSFKGRKLPLNVRSGSGKLGQNRP